MSREIVLMASFLYTVGLVWTLFTLLKLLQNFFKYFKTLVYPSLIAPADLVQTYESWAVVTGATDGIGLAFAKELAKRRVNVVLVSRGEEKLQLVAAEIENEHNGVKTKTIAVDFSNGQKVYQEIETQLQGIPVGILINNVGVGPPYPMSLTQMKEKLIWDQINVNVGATVHMTRLVLPGMQQRRRGVIVNVSSLSEKIPVPFLSIYAASKVFIKSFTEAVRAENREYGVHVQLLSPGFVSTKMLGYSRRSVFMQPNAPQYVQSAINTIGKVDRSSGHWEHSVMAFVMDMIPVSMLSHLASQKLQNFSQKRRLNRLKKRSDTGLSGKKK